MAATPSQHATPMPTTGNAFRPRASMNVAINIRRHAVKVQIFHAASEIPANETMAPPRIKATAAAGAHVDLGQRRFSAWTASRPIATTRTTKTSSGPNAHPSHNRPSWVPCAMIAARASGGRDGAQRVALESLWSRRTAGGRPGGRIKVALESLSRDQFRPPRWGLLGHESCERPSV